MTDTETRVLLSDQTDRDDFPCHIICCESETLALCGLHIGGNKWMGDETVADCVVCADLDQMGECPMHDKCQHAD